MKLTLMITGLVLSSLTVIAQEKPYQDSLQSFRTKYINEHEVIQGKDREFLRFYPIERKYAIMTRMEKIDEAPWFQMETSGTQKKLYRVYGILHFVWEEKPYKLRVYQSRDLMDNPEYATYLLIAFTDNTSGEETYENGRYIDATVADMGTGNYLLDFNKAYNPFCAYISNKYNCPVPPKENSLPFPVMAGEMKFKKLL